MAEGDNRSEFQTQAGGSDASATVMLEQFEAYRPMLFAIAYRMLGSSTDAEDIVQEAFLRYQGAAGEVVRQPKAFLGTVVTRLCLDQLKSARAQRETYIGTWLPEPVLTDDVDQDPTDRLSMTQTISMAFLVLLESLTPIERAVFLLHEIFEFSYPEIAVIVGRSESACRQLAHRAREYIAERRSRFSSSGEAQRRLTERFLDACTSGDLEGLVTMLADDISVWSDGGGKVRAALQPIRGRDNVARFLMGISRKLDPNATISIGTVNGAPAIVGRVDGRVSAVVSLEADGVRIQRVWIQVNPDKLTKL